MIKKLLFIALLLAFIIPGVLAYQQDFQNYDGDMATTTSGTIEKIPYSETQMINSTTNGAGLYTYVYYGTAQPATNWSVVVTNRLPLGLFYTRFLFYRDAVLLLDVIDGNHSTAGHVDNRYDFVLDTGSMKITTYLNGTKRQESGALAQTPNYFYAGGGGSATAVSAMVDDYIISPLPDADRATRNIIESIPYNYYIILDSLVPANNGIYNGSGLVNSGWYYNKYSTVSNASKTMEVVKWDTGVTYDSQSVGGCANETQWSIATLAASGAPTGIYNFEWDEAGYGVHHSNPFYITRGAATVSWDSHTKYSGDIATTTWTVQPGYWDLASYTYTGEIIDVYGTVQKTWSITAASGTESTTLDATTYPTGVYYTDVKRTLIAAPNTVEMLGYDYMELFSITKLSGITYNATVNATLPSVFINFTQSGVTTNTTSDGTAATYNKSGFTTGNAITIEPIKDPLLFVPVSFTPLSYGNFTINLYATNDVKNGSLTSNSTIYGLVQSSPYYNAIAGATVTAWNGTNYTSTLTNATGYYNITGCYPFTEYYMNATATGYTNTTPDYVNASSTYKGTLYNSTRHDFLLSTTYTMNITFKDSATGALIPTVTVLDSNGYSQTTSTGLFTYTYPYSLVVFYFSSSGYGSSSSSYVMDSDRDETVYLAAEYTSTAYLQDAPHFVTFRTRELMGTGISGVNVSAQGFMTSTGNYDWLAVWLGLPLDRAPLNDSYMETVSDDLGASTFLMIPTVKYQVNFSHPSYTFTNMSLMPQDTEYIIYPTGTGTSPFFPVTGYSELEAVNITITTGNWNASNSWVNISYNDTIGHTTGGYVDVLIKNATPFGAPILNYCWTVSHQVNPVTGLPDMNVWRNSTNVTHIIQTSGYVNTNVTNSDYGYIKRSYGFTFNSVPVQFLGFGQEIALLAAFGIMMFTAMLGGASNAVQVAFIVCIEAWVFEAIHWFQSLYDRGVVQDKFLLALQLATIIAVIANFANRKRKEKY